MNYINIHLINNFNSDINVDFTSQALVHSHCCTNYHFQCAQLESEVESLEELSSELCRLSAQILFQDLFYKPWCLSCPTIFKMSDRI